MKQVPFIGIGMGCFRLVRRRQPALLLIVLLTSVTEFWCTESSAAAQTQEAPSLTKSVERAKAGTTDLHIFYIHGIGINPPKKNAGTQDFEASQEFRRSVCKLKLLRCTSTFVGRNYAERDLFELNNTPKLRYLGEYLWNSKEEWNAAAPFVDHYDLRTYDGTVIHLHEINWWPLVMAAKCRWLVAPDTALVDHDKKHLAICSAKTEEQENGRYKSYNWLAHVEVPSRKLPWPKGASINRWGKHDLLDWSFADALLAVGPLRRYFIEGIREVLLGSYKPADNQEFIIVAHSLGSYLMFSALDIRDDTKPGTSTAQPNSGSNLEPQTSSSIQATERWQPRLEDFLRKTSHAYFMANQLSLLELANLDETQSDQNYLQLAAWAQLRSKIHQSATIVAFSDPNDLLTWQVPENQLCKNSVTVHNVPARNSFRLLWLFANPETAHVTYDKNKAVLNAMFPKYDLAVCQ